MFSHTSYLDLSICPSMSYFPERSIQCLTLSGEDRGWHSKQVMESMCAQRRMGNSQRSAIQWVSVFRLDLLFHFCLKIPPQVQLCCLHNRWTAFVRHCRWWRIVPHETHQPPHVDPLRREWLCVSPQELQHSECKSICLRHFLIDLQWWRLQCKKSVFSCLHNILHFNTTIC